MSRKPFIAGDRKWTKIQKKQSIRWSCSIKTSFIRSCWKLVSQLLQLTWQLYLLLLVSLNLKVAAQNTYFEKCWCLHSETSPQVWKKSVLTTFVIGHSERRLLPRNWWRHQQKSKSIFANGMLPIICCGGITWNFTKLVKQQIRRCSSFSCSADWSQNKR